MERILVFFFVPGMVGGGFKTPRGGSPCFSSVVRLFGGGQEAEIDGVLGGGWRG